MPTPKLLIFLAVWKRPEITEICFMGIDRLRKSGLFPIEAFAVISEESMKPLCEKYGIGYCFHENLPVGRKKNFGLTEAMKLKWDYLVEIGSDDVLKNEYLEVIANNLGHPFVSINHFIYLNSEDGVCRRHRTSNSFGLGRMFKRNVFERIGANIWEPVNLGLDKSSLFFLGRNGILEKRIRCENPVAIDIKSGINIWPFNYLVGERHELEKTLEGLSEEEITAIKALINATVEC